MTEDPKILDPKGAEIKSEVEKPEEKVATNENGHLAKIMVGDKEYKIVNSVTVIEIVAHQLDDGHEITQVIAQEFMMTDHKPYMVGLLTDAIKTVMKAKRNKSLIRLASEAITNRINRERNKKKGGAFGGNGRDRH